MTRRTLLLALPALAGCGGGPAVRSHGPLPGGKCTLYRNDISIGWFDQKLGDRVLVDAPYWPEHRRTYVVASEPRVVSVIPPNREPETHEVWEVDVRPDGFPYPWHGDGDTPGTRLVRFLAPKGSPR